VLRKKTLLLIGFLLLVLASLYNEELQVWTYALTRKLFP
jgi:hypothetical protein